MKFNFSPEHTEQQQQQFLEALQNNDQSTLVKLFAQTLADRDKMYLAAMSLSLKLCDSNKKEAQILLIKTLNSIAQRMREKRYPNRDKT